MKKPGESEFAYIYVPTSSIFPNNAKLGDKVSTPYGNGIISQHPGTDGETLVRFEVKEALARGPHCAELHKLLATLCGTDSPVILQLYREGKLDIWSALDLRARELNSNMEFLKILMRRMVIT